MKWLLVPRPTTFSGLMIKEASHVLFSSCAFVVSGALEFRAGKALFLHFHLKKRNLRQCSPCSAQMYYFPHMKCHVILSYSGHSAITDNIPLLWSVIKEGLLC